MRVLWVLNLLVVSSIGCGGVGTGIGPGGDGGTQGTGAITMYSDYVKLFAGNTCGSIYQCCGTATAQTLTQTQDVPSCTVAFNAVLTGRAATIETELSEGKASFVASEAQKCADANVYQCGGTLKSFVSSSCYNLFVGTLPAGSTCTAGTIACAPGTGCTYSPTNHNVLVCTPFLAAGSACVFSQSLCDYTKGEVCGVTNTCVSLYADGHTCADPTQCLGGLCANEMCASKAVNDQLCTANPSTGGTTSKM